MGVIVCFSFILSSRSIYADNEVTASTLQKYTIQEIETYLNSIDYTLLKIGRNDSAARALEIGVSSDEEDEWYYFRNGCMALMCVVLAALAAGLTMGLVSQEILDLRIKEMAGNTQEKDQARKVIPLIKDHHRLLVTLLLLNAAANEALPLFLDKIVPGYVAVILSVTLVLFFGEIIPSAIFSGPQKLAIASKLAPLVRMILWLLCPLAWPIGKALDRLLHDDDEERGFMQKYDCHEISALVRLQYEERKATKLKSKLERAKVGFDNLQSTNYSNTSHNGNSMRFVKHIDTVHMVEGALEMQNKLVMDVMVKMKDVFSVPLDLILDQESILEIYRTGYSRVPVHVPSNPDLICGIFKTKQLMILDHNEPRELRTLPLISPHCVGPQMNILSLINVLQEGTKGNRGGHMAIVCLHPKLAENALMEGNPIPQTAGILGIVTLENCIEALIKEEIYDEFDSYEKNSLAKARWAAEKWKRFVQEKRGDHDAVGTTVDVSNEETRLLQK
jgi:Hemolysins and related proteins containing CBS domains